MDKNTALHKIIKWCVYQDRSEFEVISKLKSWELAMTDISEIISYLKQENYINEERFIQSYINGKFNHKKWGIQKIKHHLKQKHGIHDSLIDGYIKYIDREDYLLTIKSLIIKKKQILEKRENNPMLLKKKIINFALSKGYALSDITDVLNQLKI